MNTVQFFGIEPTALINETAKTVITQLLPELEQRLGNNQQNQYYSADKVCELLGITKPTLHDWRKRKIIQCYKLGGRVYYRWDNIEKAMRIDE